MAVDGGPTTKVSLGGDLLAAIGDLKGAAKALGDEARDAKAEVKDVEKQLRDVEKRRKDIEKQINTIERKGGTVSPELRQQQESAREEAKKLNKEMFDRQARANKVTLKADAAKEKIGERAELRGEMNKYERRVEGKIYKVSDKLGTIARTMMQSESAIVKGAGMQLASVSGGIASAAPALAFAGGAATVAMVGAYAIERLIKSSIEHNTAKVLIKAKIDDDITAYLKSTATVSGGNQAIEEYAKDAPKRAEAYLRDKYGVDPDGLIGTFLGLNKDKKMIEADILKEYTSYGNDILAVAESQGVKDKVNLQLDTMSLSETVTRMAINRVTGGTFLESWLQKKLGVATVEELKLDEAKKQEADYWAIWQKKRDEARIRSEREITYNSQRHAEATRIQALEKQRMRTRMDWAAF